MSNTTTSGYVPGICNIDRHEIKKRRAAGYFGVALLVIVALPLFLLSISRFARLALFIPAFVAAIGFLQAQQHFCVGFAAGGIQNATDGGEAKVVEAAQKAIDKARARKMNLQAAGIALLVALIFVVV